MNALVSSYQDLRTAEPRLRARDAAHRLGVTEAELVESGSLGRALRLEPQFRGILEMLPALGEVTVICRNEAAVHETTGTFQPPQFHAGGAVTLGVLDLRIFLERWSSAFALVEETPRGARRSLQFFDPGGDAVLKVFLREELPAFDVLVEGFGLVDAPPLELAAPREEDRGHALVDVGALRAAWSAMQDTHEFHGMLKKNGVGRTQALRAVGTDWARELKAAVVDDLLRSAAARALPIMVFVGNAGAINIYTGAVERIVQMDRWLNVLDPAFNLHIDMRLVHTAFRVIKPTRDGAVTSIELFDEAGESIALFFGERKPGRPELQAWRELVAELEARHA